MAKNVLRFTRGMAAADEEVTRLGGRIVQQFSPAVFVAELPDATDEMAIWAPCPLRFRSRCPCGSVPLSTSC
ncbi:MAG: hypothetical protein I8H91_15060 [Burkholderiales bacterium]|nr:hypothetical protein [Burkholderiales bacterium]